MTFLIIALLSLSAIALLCAIFFLYRYLMRSHLFPQLPRVWRVEKVRFLVCAVVFLLCFSGFLVAGWVDNNSQKDDDSVIIQTPTQSQPSFDGAPAQPQPPERERVLPPKVEGQADQPASAPTVGGVPAESKPGVTPAPGATSAPVPAPAGKPGTIAEEPKTTPAKPERAGPVPGKPAESAAKPPAAGAGKPEEPRALPTPKPYAPEGGAPAPADSSVSSTPGLPSSTPNLPAASSAPAQTPAKVSFGVCVASYSTRAAAESQLKNYSSLGHAQIVSVDLPGKGRWYRICVGQYETSATAQAQANKWRNSGQAKGAFVGRLP